MTELTQRIHSKFFGDLKQVYNCLFKLWMKFKFMYGYGLAAYGSQFFLGVLGSDPKFNYCLTTKSLTTKFN